MFYIVREVDLIGVSFIDNVFETRQEANDYWNSNISKYRGISFALIKVLDMPLEDYVDYEFELSQQEYRILKQL